MRPAPSSGLVSHTIVLAQMSDLRHQRIIWVWIREQGAYGQQHLDVAFIKEEEEEEKKTACVNHLTLDMVKAGLH
ncbi:hypothetical protein BHM03_00037328 [Ensete ventricosum]|nr:hypothetical protein BHM03_00037328 [Ensete ventricosum]